MIIIYTFSQSNLGGIKMLGSEPIYRNNSQHPSMWMCLVAAHIDCEIFEVVMMINLLGYMTIFSCQDKNQTGYVQLIMKRQSVSNFRYFLTTNSIHSKEKVLTSGVEFLFSHREFLKLEKTLLNTINPI